MLKSLIPALALGAALAAQAQTPTDTLKGAITADKTLDTDKIWIISGFVTVDSPAVLTIKPGTKVQGQKSTKGTLAIKPGAKILAEGTKANPITFSSDEPDSSKTRGSWGGIVILGRAKNNKSDNEKFEGRDEWVYGGSNADDSSGVLKYVRLQVPGFPVAPDKELNGVTLASVGRKTVISHVQVHTGDDDGFEFFGGSVNASNLVVTNQVDDGFDSDNGFSGTVSWSIDLQGTDANRVREYTVKTGSGADSVVKFPDEVVGDKCFESSSTKLASGDATPQTKPTWANITCIDNGKSGGAINLNEHAVGAFKSVLLVGDSSAYAVRLQSSKTNAGLLADPATLSFTKSYLAGTWKAKFSTDDSANSAIITAALTNSFKTVGGAPLYKDLGLVNDTLKNDSVGAVLGNNPEDFWYQGWTFPGSVNYAKGETRTVGIRDGGRAQVRADLFSVNMAGGILSLRSSFNALVSVEIMDMNGRSVWSVDGMRLAKGENRLGRPWGRLNAGAYFLTVRSGDYAVHYRFSEAAR